MYTGWSWASAENVRGHLLALNQALVATEASGSLHVHATDGTSFGTCDVDYHVSTHL